MFTQIEETIPLLSKQEYIALEITKALIADKQLNIISMASLIHQSTNAATQMIEESVPLE